MRSVLLGTAAVLALGAGIVLLPAKPAPQQPLASHVVFQPGVAAHVPVGEIRPGGEIVLEGALRSTIDGAVLDAATRTDYALGVPTTRPGGYFEIERAGLRLVTSDPITHSVKLVASGGDASACEAAGLAGPCLVPRTKDLAREGMIAEGELARSLHGKIEAKVPRVAVAAPIPPAPLASYGLFGAAGLLLGAAGASFARKRRASPMGRVRAEADRARAATSRDPSLGELHRKIVDLVARAESLDATRLACEARARKIDRAALLGRRATLEKGGPEAADTLGWIDREIAEADRVDEDARLAIAGIERVIAALSVIALASREERGVRVRAEVDDPVEAVRVELERREEARAEVEDEVALRRQAP